MIYFIIGTKAQLIKMAPVIKAVDNKALAYRFIFTGQHQETVNEIANNFGIKSPDYTLYEGPDIVSIPKMIVWAIRILWHTFRNKDRIFVGKGQGIVLVHGDTFSTLLGALMAKIGRQKAGHVESGLRSFNFLNPFPEEIIRLIVFHLSDIYFSPGKWASQNLSKYSGVVVDTHQNTLYDALSYALASTSNRRGIIPNCPYGVVSLHRYENILSRSSLLRIIEIVEHIAQEHHLLFILHKPTGKKLHQFGLYDRLKSSENIEMRDRYDYFGFITLLSGAEFVVSDGGSNQEECAYLGKPVLLLRRATERKEGVGHNCILSNFDYRVINQFLKDYKILKRAPFEVSMRPSDIIVESCMKFYPSEVRVSQ